MSLLKAAQRGANVSLSRLPDWPDFARRARHHLAASLSGYISESPIPLPDATGGSAPAGAAVAAAAQAASDGESGAAALMRPGLTPGPLSYVTSGYCLMIVLITVVINRVMNVVPPRRPFRMSGAMRLSLRLPSALLLLRALYLVSGKLPWLAQHVSPLAEGPAHAEDAHVLWTVFLALGLNSVTECFCKALNNDLHAQASVNLLSYSYLLHFHSHPSSSPVMRPTSAVYLLIALTLSETLSLQTMEALAINARLFITACFSVIGQCVMLFCVFREDSITALLPSLQYCHRIPEALFFALSILTVLLHALVQLLVERRLTTAIFGHPSNLPSRSDDFSIAVIRYGTACLETTALAGFGNEVGVVSAPVQPFVEFNRGSASVPGFHAFPTTTLGRGYTAPEVKDVKARAGLPKESDPLSRSPATIRECMRFAVALKRLLHACLRSVVRRIAPPFRLEGRAGRNDRMGAVLRWMGVPSESDGWSRAWAVRRWQEESDVDDPDYTPLDDRPSSPTSTSSSSSSGRDSDVEEDGYATVTPSRRSSREPSAEPGALALVADAEEADASADLHAVLLAHLSHGRSPNSGPLTRRGYRAPQDADVALASMIADRRQAVAQRQDQEGDGNQEVQSLCVVCRCEMRTVIFWPCRCLAVCEDCKDHLGARSSSGGQHLCVCCRRPVDGWSRIFVP